MFTVSGLFRRPRAATAFIAAFALFAISVHAPADVIKVGDRLYADGWLGGQATGPITIHPITPSNFPAFKTFCAELGQNIYVNGGPGYDYYVSKIGFSSDGDHKNLTEHVAWLYSAYLKGTLFNYTDDTRHDNALQYGIWSSLGYTDAELSRHGYDINQFRSDYQSYGWNATPTSWSGFGDIRIANLLSHDANGGQAQDQLVAVPEPASALLLGIPASLYFCSRRRRSKPTPQA